MNDDVLACFPVHETKRAAVKEALGDLESVSLGFWRYLEGESQHLLHKQLLHLHALREEVITTAYTLLEADAELVTCKARANKALRNALAPTVGPEQDVALEPHQSPLLSRPESMRLYQALKLNATEADTQAWTRMSRDWKMLLYSVRCIHDCIYGALLLVQGEQAGRRASMAICLKADKKDKPKPNRLMLERRVPGYYDWFMRMKGIRDELKRGLTVASNWTDGEHTILLSESYPDGDFIGSKNVRRLSLDFAAECLHMCAATTNAVRAELAGIRGPTPADTLPSD